VLLEGAQADVGMVRLDIRPDHPLHHVSRDLERLGRSKPSRRISIVIFGPSCRASG
jgi:hypothetical protein